MALPEGFVYLEDVDSTILQDMRYASHNNFMGRPAEGYVRPVAILTEVAARRLKAVQSEFARLGFGVIVYDAYRPQSAVDDFWRWANDNDDIIMQQKYYPTYTDKTKLFSDGFIARFSKHSRGSTVDLSLVDASGKEVDMGAPFDYFGPISHTASDEIGPEARSMRELLKEVMESHGFDNYRKEWWHYELLDEPFKRKPEDHLNFKVE